MTGLTHSLQPSPRRLRRLLRPRPTRPSEGGPLRRLVRDRAAFCGGVLLAVLVSLALAGALGRDWRALDLSALREPPSARHWFGTTGTGRDMFALSLRGMRRSLAVGLSAGLLATAIAALVGAFAGLVGGPADRLLMGTADLLLVLPGVLLVAVLAPEGASWGTVVLLLAAFLWPLTARTVRAQTRALAEREFVLAAFYTGASRRRVVLRHLLPNLAGLLSADAAVNVGVAIMGESGLAFLGFGVRPPDVSLGILIADGTSAATVYPWLFLPPAVLLTLIVLAVNLLGDGLHRAMDADR
ncbi:ABC transporter permease [Actinocorallia populi]|uniref:ABC transporter permease n=1 Tax=Actinocorallia populi TaxID=2079200 RepID=UPI000D08A278|nr:ABC transporter permease [Actinocorallia populi]